MSIWTPYVSHSALSVLSQGLTVSTRPVRRGNTTSSCSGTPTIPRHTARLWCTSVMRAASGTGLRTTSTGGTSHSPASRRTSSRRWSGPPVWMVGLDQIVFLDYSFPVNSRRCVSQSHQPADRCHRAHSELLLGRGLQFADKMEVSGQEVLD